MGKDVGYFPDSISTDNGEDVITTSLYKINGNINFEFLQTPNIVR